MNNSTIQYLQKREILMDTFEVESDILDLWLEELGVHTGPTHFEKAKFNKIKKSKRYLISSAQTASPVNKVFFNNMKAYADYIDAEIALVATRYKNPTSIWKEEGDVWDELSLPYLTAMRQDLHPNLCLLADLKIQATSPNPTSGIDNFEGIKSCIVGSPTIEMRSIPTIGNQIQKFLYSTGSITEPSFTDTVAGGKAAESHSFGFLVVEVENENIVHVRNVKAENDGTFNDLLFRVEKEVVSEEEVDTMIWGDSHFAQKEKKVTNAFRKVCLNLGITNSVLHDVWDSKSINVHNLKDPIVQHELMKNGEDDLKKEFAQLVEELDWFSKNMKETLVIGSNHDDMLDRALVQSDWRANLKNAEFFLKCLRLKLSGKATKGVIPYTINKKFNNVIALGVDESFIKYGVELALHGHKGPNGSRGSITSFAKLPMPCVIGHSHSPGIKKNCYQVGVSCKLDQGYNKGLSSWAYASTTLNKRGIRQMILLNKETLTYTTLY